jgi:hypothetical protein
VDKPLLIGPWVCGPQLERFGDLTLFSATGAAAPHLGRRVEVLACPEYADNLQIAGALASVEELLRAVDHPALLSVVAAGPTSDSWIAWNDVDGAPLCKLRNAASEGMALPLVLTMARVAAELLALAHERGTIFRGVFEDALLIDREGLVRLRWAPVVLARSPTQAGLIISGVRWVAPEEVRAAPLIGQPLCCGDGMSDRP